MLLSTLFYYFYLFIDYFLSLKDYKSELVILFDDCLEILFFFGFDLLLFIDGLTAAILDMLFLPFIFYLK